MSHLVISTPLCNYFTWLCNFQCTLVCVASKFWIFYTVSGCQQRKSKKIYSWGPARQLANNTKQNILHEKVWNILQIYAINEIQRQQKITHVEKWATATCIICPGHHKSLAYSWKKTNLQKRAKSKDEMCGVRRSNLRLCLHLLEY